MQNIGGSGEKMDAGLVDLSLFTIGPTNHESSRSNDYDAPSGHQLLSTSTWPPRSPNRTTSPVSQTCLTKPLPKVPRRGLCDFLVVDAKANNNRCILKRMKRVKLESVLGDRALTATPSAYATARSAYINPNEPSPSPPSQQSIQERRNPLAVPQLTLPSSNDTTVSTTQGGLPMIWLADEQMWLVADPLDPGYGYYATGPEDGMDEWLPPYTESEAPPSDPSSSDLSPVREQFMHLMESGRSRSPNNNTNNDTEPGLSPLFQEATQGVGLLDFSSSSTDYDISPSASRRNPHDPRPHLLRTSNKRQYIPYRPMPNSHQPPRPDSQTTHRSSTQKSQQTDLSLEEWSPLVPPQNPFVVLPPRSTSHALRTPPAQQNATNWGKYASEAEIKRHQERVARRRGALEREESARERRSSSCYSDSGVSTYTTPDAGGLDVGPTPGFWGVQRASSARH